MNRRILLLNTDLEIGGTPTVVRELATRLHDPPGVDVRVACLSKWGPVADDLRSAGISVTALDAKGVSDVWVVRRLTDLLQREQIDTVLSFLVHANATAAAAKAVCPAVRFFQSIQTTQASPAWHWRVQRFVHHAAEKIIVPSNSVALVAQSRSKVPLEKIVVIPNAIDREAFTPSPIPLRDPRPYPIGFIGRLDPVKMIPDLLMSVNELCNQRTASTVPTFSGTKTADSTSPFTTATSEVAAPVHLHIFGAGAERPSIERAIRLLNLSPHVTLHGPVARPQQALSQIGLLVLPSISEGFGLVLIEAMAASVPVVARDVPGVRDVVTNEVNGLLAKSLLVTDLTAAVRRVIDDRPLRERLILGGAATVAERFTWDRVMPQYRRVLGIGKMSLTAWLDEDSRQERQGRKVRQEEIADSWLLHLNQLRDARTARGFHSALFVLADLAILAFLCNFSVISPS